LSNKKLFNFIYDNSFKDLLKTRTINYSSDIFMIAGKPYEWWCSNYSLPLHINFEKIIRKNLNDFKKVMNQNYSKGIVCFSVKTYPHKEILKIVSSEGVGADVVSDNELKACLESGISKEKLVLNGNVKEDELIEKAIMDDIVIISDNIEDLKIINSIAKKLQKKANLLLRLSGFNLGEVSKESVFTSGLWTKFGENIENIDFLKDLICQNSLINFLGFQTHIGTQIIELKTYLTVIEKMIELSLKLQEKNIKISMINIGGGFPVEYLNLDQKNYMDERIKEGYNSSLKGNNKEIFSWGNAKPCKNIFYTKYPKSKMLDKIFSSVLTINREKFTLKKALGLIGDPYFVVEPGRAIVADSGITMAKVSYTRIVANNHQLINVNFAGSNMVESLFYPNMKKWIIVNQHKLCDKAPYEAFVAGNLCFTGDMLAKYKVILQRKPLREDILLIFDTGGTGQHFLAATPNSFARPARLLVFENGNVVTLKKRDSYEDIF
jgi:diaminopimelate decarboxylase